MSPLNLVVTITTPPNLQDILKSRLLEEHSALRSDIGGEALEATAGRKKNFEKNPELPSGMTEEEEEELRLLHTRVGIGSRAVGASFEVEPGDTVTLYAAILPSKDSISRRVIKLLLAGQRCAFVC